MLDELIGGWHHACYGQTECYLHCDECISNGRRDVFCVITPCRVIISIKTYFAVRLSPKFDLTFTVLDGVFFYQCFLRR